MRHPRLYSSVPVDGDRTPAGVEGVELQAHDRTVVGVDVARRSDEHQRPCTHRLARSHQNKMPTQNENEK